MHMYIYIYVYHKHQVSLLFSQPTQLSLGVPALYWLGFPAQWCPHSCVCWFIVPIN